MTAKTILFRILVCATIVLLWLWMSADDWEQEIEFDRAERERITAIQEYQQSKRADRTDEDYVDTTPIPTVEPAEPTYISAKKSVVKAKKRVKRAVKSQAR
jgi:hypothetical protein